VEQASSLAAEPVAPTVRPLADQWLALHPWGRVLVNAFILWQLFALTIYLLPQSDLRQNWVAPCASLSDCAHRQSWVTSYMTFTGFMQSWTMFAPNPANVDFYFEARITYADGRVRSWDFPRMVRLGYMDRYRQERWRKLIENANSDENQMVWPSLARYAARRNNRYPGNLPVSVALVRHFRFIPPPGLLLAPFRTYTFYTTAITPRELR
jgi:hypothetical protein